jgi:plasmid stability protein
LVETPRYLRCAIIEGVAAIAFKEDRPMSQLTVRKLDLDVVRRLKLRAAEHGRSAEAEHRAILEEALGGGTRDFWARARAFREATRGRRATDSVDLLRTDRRRDLERAS